MNSASGAGARSRSGLRQGANSNARATSNMVTVLDDRSRSHYEHQADNLVPSEGTSEPGASGPQEEEGGSMAEPWMADSSSAPDAIRSVRQQETQGLTL